MSKHSYRQPGGPQTAMPVKRSPVGRIVVFAFVLFGASLTWRAYQTNKSKTLTERLKKTDDEAIAKLAADCKSSRGFARDLEKGLDKAATRKTTLQVIALGATQEEPWAVEAFDRILKEGHTTVKLDLAEALRPHTTRGAAKDLTLLSRLMGDTDPAVRLASAGAMLMYGAASAETVKKTLAESPYNELVDALGASVVKGDEKHLEAFKSVATGPNPALRERAMLSLGGANPAEKAPPYFGILEKGLTDPADNVAKAAAKAMVRHGPCALPSMENALKSKNRRMREAAADALAEAPAMSVRLSPLIFRNAVTDEPDLGKKMADLLAVVPPVDDLIKAMQEEAKGKDKDRVRSVVVGLMANPAWPPDKADCGELQPVAEIAMDMPCEGACLGKARKEESPAFKAHECYEEVYKVLFTQLGTGGRSQVAKAWLGEKGKGKR